jgi:hypothetical protein
MHKLDVSFVAAMTRCLSTASGYFDGVDYFAT